MEENLHTKDIIQYKKNCMKKKIGRMTKVCKVKFAKSWVKHKQNRSTTFGRCKKGADNKGATKRAQNKKGAGKKGAEQKGRRAKRAQNKKGAEQKGRKITMLRHRYIQGRNFFR